MGTRAWWKTNEPINLDSLKIKTFSVKRRKRQTIGENIDSHIHDKGFLSRIFYKELSKFNSKNQTIQLENGPKK